jgi:hypothetical protein
MAIRAEDHGDYDGRRPRRAGEAWSSTAPWNGRERFTPRRGRVVRSLMRRLTAEGVRFTACAAAAKLSARPAATKISIARNEGRRTLPCMIAWAVHSTQTKAEIGASHNAP